MLITAIAMVKNESDIIEYFIRYNLTIFDLVLIFEDNSTDNTFQILDMLSHEFNERLIVLNSNSNQIDSLSQSTISKSLFSLAFKQFKSDVCVPLDADEFIISTANRVVREVLESIELNQLYKASWRTVVLDNYNYGVFEPTKLLYIRDPSLFDESEKIIITKGIWNTNLIPALGNHNLYSIEESANLPSSNIEDLKLLHFPIRSSNQFINKVVSWKLRFRVLSNYQKELDSNYDYFINRYFNQENLDFDLSIVNLHYGKDLRSIKFDNQFDIKSQLVLLNRELPIIETLSKPVMVKLRDNLIDNFINMLSDEGLNIGSRLDYLLYNGFMQAAKSISKRRFLRLPIKARLSIIILKTKYIVKPILEKLYK